MNLFAFVGLIVSIASVFLGFYCLLNAQNRVHIIWSCFSFSVALWGLGIYKIALAVDVNSAVFWWRIAEIGVIFIPVLLTHFVLEFLGFHKNKFLFALYLLTSFFVFINLFTNYFFGPVRFVFGQFYYITSTPFYTLFIIAFLGLAIYDTFILYREYGRKEFFVKKQIEFFILAFIIGFSGGVTSFLPVYGIDTYPIFNFTIFISAILVSYSIFKYKLFNIKLLVAELLTFAIGAAVISQAVMADTLNGKILGGTTSVFVLIAGVFLIKSVKKEVALAEDLGVSNKKLEVSNRDLSVANEKLKGLDKLKSEFLSLASHQLRSPLTAIKGYTSMLVEGSYGKLEEKQKEIVGNVQSTAQSMISMVEDFLNVSKIEQGGMQYVFVSTDLSKMVATLFGEMKISAESKHLDFALEMDVEDTFTVNADAGKLKQVFLNLVDNSIKYTPSGFVHMSLVRNREKNTVTFSVKDSGVGVGLEAKEKLFQKFNRGEGGKLNTGGSGIGLYLAKEIAEAHEGRIWAESKGEGMGSQFYVELEAKG